MIIIYIHTHTCTGNHMLRIKDKHIYIHTHAYTCIHTQVIACSEATEAKSGAKAAAAGEIEVIAKKSGTCVCKRALVCMLFTAC